MSKRVYAEQKQATAPPKTEAVVAGKSVKVDANAPGLSSVRSKSSDYIRPERRVERTTTIIERHHYHHPYSYYSSQPVVYVGGGYSSAFWWIMMSEWSAQRRADWLYHNRYRIDQDAYNRGVQDAQVQARLAALESQNVARNNSYVDPDFQESPDLMYDQNYVEAVYNPAVTEVRPASTVVSTRPVVYKSGPSFGKTLLWIVFIGGGVVVLYLIVTKVRFGD